MRIDVSQYTLMPGRTDVQVPAAATKPKGAANLKPQDSRLSSQWDSLDEMSSKSEMS